MTPPHMPDDIQQAIDTVDDPALHQRLYQQWFTYAKENAAYELNYSQQFANLVEGNQKFKQNKTIPTPAEQMRGYNDAIRSEVTTWQEARAKEEQALAEQALVAERKERLAGFRLDWVEMSAYEKSEEPTQAPPDLKEQFKASGKDAVTSEKPAPPGTKDQFKETGKEAVTPNVTPKGHGFQLDWAVPEHRPEESQEPARKKEKEKEMGGPEAYQMDMDELNEPDIDLD